MALPAAFQRLAILDEAWRISCPGRRLEAVRQTAPRLKDAIVASGKPAYVRTCDTATAAYPTRFALQSACLLPLPFVMFRNRLQVVRWQAGGRLRTLLVNPTDADRSRRAPFFAKQISFAGERLATRVFSQKHAEILTSLTALGIRPEEVDYLTFDHLHVQDLRRLLGEWFPNAVLLAQREELAIFERLHPMQHAWFIPDALDGIDPKRCLALDGDYLIGPGVALVRTPGHTAGNHTIVLHTDGGVWTISENGLCVDNYAPEASDIPGLRRFARFYEVEVILNANTREQSLDQYTSMILEKMLADPSHSRPEFGQHFSSSEMIRHPLAPGLAPTLQHGGISHGNGLEDVSRAAAAT